MALRQLLLPIVGLVLTLGLRRHSKRSTSDDEMRSDDHSEAACVDCPSYVARSASSKKSVLWNRIESDEYSVPYETYCSRQEFTCTCDGMVRFGHKGTNRWTAWKSVRDSIKCSSDAFGENPARWEMKECYCKHEFPMNWVGLIERNLGDQMGRVNNGTMPIFFDRFSDENPPNAAKVIHTFGSTALVRFVPKAGTGFTGMFKTGAQHAVLRLSIVADWTQPCKGGTDFNFNGCFKPSLALKMLRDDDYSSNTVAQVNLGDGVGMNFDFFRVSHATLLPRPHGIGAEVVKMTFKHASQDEEIHGVGLQELASDGSKAHQRPSQIKDPQVIFFVPTSEVRGKFSNDMHDVRHDFKTIRSGTKLYDVFSVDFGDSRCSPDGEPVVWDELGGRCPKQFLGYVETTSRFVASAYQDHRLFFQHERLKTKGGRWGRQMCASSKTLPAESEFRLAADQKKTCTQQCLKGTSPVSGSCPFSELE